MQQIDIDARLDRWQSELLDLTRRNKMLNYRVTSRSTLGIAEPGFDEMYVRMSAEGAALSFQRPLDRATDARVYSMLALLESLGTPLTVMLGDIRAEGSMLERQKTLSNLRQKARLALEEQGANILYLSFGFLSWRDGEGAQSAKRLAPLVLMPVSITQSSVGAPLMLERRDEEVIANPTLEYFLKSEYGIGMPPFDPDAPALDGYFERVEQAVAARGWKVVRAASLGLLSFLKLSMYQDMERSREKLRAHPIIRAIAGDAGSLGDGGAVERDFHDSQDPRDCFQVVGADSSQQDAIELSRRGVSFIMQGPPGTGKSQTITNIISQAMADGRRVLFVAEKSAALQVVYRKLQDAGLGDFCLPIHSHKANKREVLSELKRTLELDQRQVRSAAMSQLEQLGAVRGELSGYVRALHEEIEPLAMSVYDACGRLASIADAPGLSFDVPGVRSASRAALDARCESARIYGLARAACGPDNPFEGVSADVSGARRDALLGALRCAVRDMADFVECMPDLRARGLESARLGELDELRAALTAATSVRVLPACWRDGRSAGQLRELVGSLRAGLAELERGRADIASFCGEGVLDADMDAVVDLRERLCRITGAYPRSKQELGVASDALERETRALMNSIDALSLRARAYCALTGMDGDGTLSGADGRARALDMLISCLELPDGCVLAAPDALERALKSLEPLVAERAALLEALSGADISGTEAARQLRELEKFADVAAAARTAGLNADPSGLAHLAGMALKARDEYARLCGDVLRAAQCAQMDGLLLQGQSLESLLKIGLAVGRLNRVPARWLDAGARAELARKAGELRVREQALAAERAGLEREFTPQAFQIDCAALLRRFDAERASLLRMFRPSYRANRQLLRDCCINPAQSDDVLSQSVKRVADYNARMSELHAEIWSRAELLGEYLHGGSVDWDALLAALGEFDELCGLLGDDSAILAAKQRNHEDVARLNAAILKLMGGVTNAKSLGIHIADGNWAAGEAACLDMARRAGELKELLAAACAEPGGDESYAAACGQLKRAVRLAEVNALLAAPGDELRALAGGHAPAAPEGWAELADGMRALCSLTRAQGGHLTMRTRELLLSPHARGFVREALALRADEPLHMVQMGGAEVAAGCARLTGQESDPRAELPRLRAGLEEVLRRCDAGMAAFDAACAALKPGADARSILDFAPDLARLRLLRAQLCEGGGATAALDGLYRGQNTDWEHVGKSIDLWERACELAVRMPGCAGLIIGACGTGADDLLCDRALAALNAAGGALAALGAVADCFECDLLAEDAEKLHARLARCVAAPERLDGWLDMARARRACLDTGMGDFVRAWDECGWCKRTADGREDAALHANGLSADAETDSARQTAADAGARARDAYERGFLTRWLDKAVGESKELCGFSRAAQDGRVDTFRQLDDLQLKIARARLRQMLCGKLPGEGYAVRAGDEYAVLMRELGKRQRHMPLRKLFGAIPNLLMRLKPCLMMSPLSVSYFLEAETYRFDTVIFDEASQILPQDAIGAIARGAQVIIAGDPMQLPPTRFFASSLDADPDGDDDGADEPLYDSILECAGAVLPRCMLKWHYRSRHEHLIAFSNAEIYEGGLITFPGAREKQRDMGVEYVYVEDGVYEGQGINQKEARRCVQLVHRHILTHPERSLGVVAFSQKQQAAIEYALERFRLSHPELEWFFGEADEDGARRDEPFFIKNLENVQGDERDTIIFSIGYGKNRQGRMYMRFGPLSGAGGERRLNVAITRAKRNVKLVGSIQPGDIDLSRTASVGARMLRDYMEFAISGRLLPAKRRAALPDRDEFCDCIAALLARAGYDVARRVGCSAYTIDIALRHPDVPGAYFAGIECDGPVYASARTVRERDHLRADVLEGMGWRLMRVWAREFLSDPHGQAEGVLAFARDALRKFTTEAPAPEPAEPLWDDEELTRSVVPEPVPQAGPSRFGIRPYVAAAWADAPRDVAPEVHLVTCMKYIISVEQPLHTELLYRRMAGFFGNEKVTAASRRAIEEALAPLLGAGVERTEQGFLYLMPRPPICARTPAPGEAPRRIEHIAPEEIEAAMCGIIGGTFGITPEALMSETVRALGFDRAGARINAALGAAYGRILSGGRACLLDGKLKLTGGE